MLVKISKLQSVWGLLNQKVGLFKSSMELNATDRAVFPNTPRSAPQLSSSRLIPITRISVMK